MLSKRIILLVLSLTASVAVVGAGVYYGTDVFELDRENASHRGESETASAPSPGNEEQAADAAEGNETALAPTFDIIRVEPSGEIVTAGRAAPGADVDMLLNEERIASDTANNDGEWAMVPADPLPIGSHELALRATGADGEGGPVEGDRVIVVIEGEDRTPLVALTRPGVPSEIVQRPEERASLDQEPDEVAQPEGDVVIADGGAAEHAVDATGEAPAVAEAPAAAEAAPEQMVAAVGAAVAEETQAAELPVPEAPAAEAVAEPVQARDVVETDPVSADTAEAVQAPAAAETGRERGTSTETMTAALPDPGDAGASEQAGHPAEEAETPARTDVAIEAVEVEEPDHIHVAGRADPGSSVRLYVNNRHLDDVRAGDDGRWATTIRQSVPPGRYAVRADAIDRDGEVGARSEVRFDRVQVALAENGTRVDAASPGIGASSATSGGSAADMPTTPSSAPAIPAEAAEIQPSGAVAAAASDAAEGSVEDGLDPANAVFIERGDNLWRIARVLYGRGARYSVIYDANRAQIRDPDLIYPGQIFTVPVLDDAAE